MRWDRLLPEPADERIRLAMLRQFFDHSLFSLISAVLLVVLHIAYAWDDVAGAWLAAWVLAFASLIAVRAGWRRSVLALAPAALVVQQGSWRQRAILGSGVTGVLWALAMGMVFDPARPSSTMYCAMLTCITTVASISVMAPLPRAFVALVLPIVLTLLALFLQVGLAAELYYSFILLAGLAMAMALQVRHTRLLYDSHAMRYEREGLLAQADGARAAQTRFLAAASHDLRQPVHALGLLAAQVKVDLQRGGSNVAATASQLEAMAQTLDGLVDALLDVSRLDGSAIQPRPAPMPLAALFDRLAREFAVLADERGLQWRLRPTDLWVNSDAELLERMLRNLLVNALRYTPRGGVLLAARRRGARVALSVWDSGVGIAPEHQSRVFDEFVQLHNPGRDRRLGHGLGLAIVARLSRLLEHPVSLRSRLGRGSCFTIELPLAAPQRVPASAPAPAFELPLSGLAVALVEDDEAVREVSVALMRSWGCRVWAAAALAPLLAQLQADGVTLDRIISDWRLAQENGLDAITGLRGWAGSELPALLISGETLPHDLPLLGQRITAVRKPLPATALRAWLSAPAPSRASGVAAGGL
ncbi:MAG: hybrid sensor histidine kinase/response regulator [Rubrivivax sp.]|nr:hybrid sensor histidine kinase/response regulator [Rubrivivax sp.]